MRNTFVKLFLALALCFMVGWALVACGSDFTLTVEDGYFVVNGEKTDVKAPEADAVADCEHDVKKYEVKAHTADAEGVVLEVCTKCDAYAKTTAGTIHDFVEGEVKATCTTDGFKGLICSICGKFDKGEVTDPAKHAWGEETVLVNNSGVEDVYACMDGGVAVQHCADCGLVSEPKAVEAVGHIATTWSYGTNAPTEENPGTASGTCIYCGAGVDYALPALNDQDYDVSWKNGVVATCEKKGVKIYTYKVTNKQNDADVWDKNIDFDFETAEQTADHVIGGKPSQSWINKEGYYQFYADVNGDGKVEPVGFKEYAQGTGSKGKIPCEGVASAYFNCEACDFVVPLEGNVYKAHFGAETIVSAATCNTLGTKKVDCQNCKTSPTFTYTVDHDFKYELVRVEGVDYAANQFTLVEKCYNSKAVGEGTAATTKVCHELKASDFAADMDAAVVAKLIGLKTTDKVTTTEIKKVKATCYSPAYTVYQYDKELAGGATTPVIINVNEKVVDREGNPVLDEDGNTIDVYLEHTLNGKRLDEYEVVSTDIKGISPVSGVKFDKCGETYPAIFECSVCVAYKASSGADIGTVASTSAVMKHNYVNVEATTNTAPTCTVIGKQAVKCLNEKCADAKGTNIDVPALKHDYVLTYDVDLDEDVLTVKGVCKRDCDDIDSSVEGFVSLSALENVNENGFSVINKTEATCLAPKTDRYSGVLALYVTVVEEPSEPSEPAEPAEPGEPSELSEPAEPQVVTSVWFATKKANGSYEEDYYLTVNYEKPVGTKLAHKYCGEEDYKKVVYNRDWNNDGEVDAVETYSFKYCEYCNLSQQVGEAEVKQLTEVTKAPDEEN